VPRLEVEHARAEGRVERVESYPEYPGDPHPMQQWATLLQSIGFKAGTKIGADHTGYPWILGTRVPVCPH